MAAWFYILRLKSGALYSGATENLERRLKDHESGRACRTTNLDPFEALVYREEFESFVEARRRETQVKHWTRAKKKALIAGDMGLLKRLAKRRKASE